MKRLKKAEFFEKTDIFLKEMLNVIVSVYMMLIIAIMPFYFTDGYGRIGSNKYEFFYSVTTKMGLVFAAVVAIYWLFLLWFWGEELKNGKRIGWTELVRNVKSSFSLTDRFALGYGVVLVFSYLSTDFREMTPYGDAFKGSNGWYMGFSTQMLFLAIYFAVSRFWKPQKWMMGLGMISGFAVFFLGYCNRFSIYPIEMEYANPSFISTIGNINWFCGYTVTVFFGMLYYWWSGAEKNKWLKGVLTAYCIVGFAALITQGSNSGILALLAMLVTFYLLSMKRGQSMQKFWMMVVLLSVTGCITMLLRYIFPESFLLEDPVTDVFTYSIVPIVVLVISAITCLLISNRNKNDKYPDKVFVTIGKVGVCAAAVLFLLLLLGIVVNTLVPGKLGSLSELSIFTFDEKWGSYRGATYIAGMKTWLAQDFWGKLFGVGPDCMAMYIHGGNHTELQDMVRRIWGADVMLTNAHCEWLTVLVDVGLLGLVGFAGMIISAIVRFIKAGKDNVIAAACGVSILAYTVNNVVSFQQAMATTTMFVILGVGESCMRKQEDTTHTGDFRGSLPEEG